MRRRPPVQLARATPRPPVRGTYVDQSARRQCSAAADRLVQDDGGAAHVACGGASHRFLTFSRRRRRRRKVEPKAVAGATARHMRCSGTWTAPRPGTLRSRESDSVPVRTTATVSAVYEARAGRLRGEEVTAATVHAAFAHLFQLRLSGPPVNIQGRIYTKLYLYGTVGPARFTLVRDAYSAPAARSRAAPKRGSSGRGSTSGGSAGRGAGAAGRPGGR